MLYKFDHISLSIVEKVSIILLFFCFSCQPKHDVPRSLDLDSNWQFKKVSDTNWYSATVPGNVFLDLLEHQLIEDPFIGNNENEVQWVSEENWEYKTQFNIDEETLSRKNIQLNFEGLDTYAKVFLNYSLILKANNAFRKWEVDVKSLLREENTLHIRFESTSKQEAIEKAKLSYELPEGDRVFTRKAQFQYGWDWGPKLNTSGIWKPIKLVSWNDFKIENFKIQQLEIEDDKTFIVIDFSENGVIDPELSFDVFINDSLTKSFKNPNPLIPNWIPIEIKNPKLWWPHNLGEPYLYDIKVVVKNDQKILDSVSVKHGIRTINLVTEKDSIGESFYFNVNGVPVYTKGANYIPQHSFQNKVTNAHYEKLLSDVVDANMNMLRVWGGGNYENDIFYDLCDEKGILVWQDFMYACAMYPGDEEFLTNAEKEAEEQVKRLRNHPSIALWCGNNESSEGWRRWGWQANRSDAEKEEIWNNYLKLFDSILPNTVKRFSSTDYWESSPKYGRGNQKYKVEGDAHDWWIWHDAFPFEHLEDNVPRFMSEFGFQSFPSYEAIRFINQSDSINISTDEFKNHQKHSRGFQLIEEYMTRDFPVPNTPEDYVYMSQLLQAHGITMGIEAQRRSRPYNTGTLYWQLNDCWPVVSWSSIDFMGNWKALHYKAKRSFENVLVSNTIEDNIIETFLVNDSLEAVEGNLQLEIRTFDNDSIWSINKDITAEANSSQRKYRFDFSGLEFDKSNAVLITNFNGHRVTDYFVSPKDLKLPEPELKLNIITAENGFNIFVSSETLQKAVFLYTKTSGHFSDNFFDIRPNEIKKIHFKTKGKTLNDLKYKSLNQFLR